MGHLTDKFDDKVGHLNTILARGGGNLNDPIFKSSNARGLPGGGGGAGVMLKFRLVGCSNTFQILLLFVKGQGHRGKRKHPKRWERILK